MKIISIFQGTKAIVLVVCLLIAVGSLAATNNDKDDEVSKPLDTPVSISVNTIDGNVLRGKITAIEKDGFLLVPVEGKPQAVEWDALSTRSLYSTFQKVHDPRDPEALVRLGGKLLWREDGKSLATTTLDRAKALGDDKIDEAVDQLIEDHEKAAAAKAEKAEKARREKAGRFFSDERIKLEQPMRLAFVDNDRQRVNGWMHSYDRHGFLLTEAAKAPPRPEKKEAVENTHQWTDIPDSQVVPALRRLLQGKPAESWFNAGSILIWRDLDEQAEQLFSSARRMDQTLEARIDELKDRVAKHRADRKKQLAERREANQKITLTYERVTLIEPIEIDFGSGANAVEGDLVAFDVSNIYLADDKAETKERHVPWASLRASDATELLGNLIDEKNAGGWFRAGRLLLSIPDGERQAKVALERAYKLDEKLKEPIQVVWRDYSERMAAAKKVGKTSGGAVPTRVAIGSGTLREGDARENTQDGEVAFITDFDCGLQHPVKRLGASHFVIDLPKGRQTNGFFLFRLKGVAGKTVQIDFRNAPLNKWGTLNPVFTYADDLNDPDNFIVTISRKTRLSAQGIPIPIHESDGDEDVPSGWHYLSTVWKEGNNLALIHKFPADAGDSVYIAMKYPYTPKLSDVYMKALKEQEEKARKAGQDPEFAVYEVGKSKEARPLWALQVGKGLERIDLESKDIELGDRSKKRPCVVLYAREHGDEHDSSWPVQGAIEFLLADTREARKLREDNVFLLIPMIDPDGAANNLYEDMIRSFREGKETTESIAWAQFFHQWMRAGNRLDLVLNLHNVESGEGPHVFPAQFEPDEKRNAAAKLYNDHLARELKQSGYSFRTGTHSHGVSRFRLGGHLHHYYYSLHQPYEVNSQAAERHLDLYDLKAIGPLMVRASTKYFRDDNSESVQSQTTTSQRLWARRIGRYELHFQHKTLFGLEFWCRFMPELEREWQRTKYPRRFNSLNDNLSRGNDIPDALE